MTLVDVGRGGDTNGGKKRPSQDNNNVLGGGGFRSTLEGKKFHSRRGGEEGQDSRSK